MTRPTKQELIQRFFPEVFDKAGSRGDHEAAIKVNTLACEAILADLLNLYDKGFNACGPGALCLRIAHGTNTSGYVPLGDFRADLAMAESTSAEMAAFLSDVIAQIDSTNPEKAALLLLLDNSRAQLFPISREFPAQSIQSIMEEHSA